MRSYILLIVFAVAASKVEANLMESHAQCMAQEHLSEQDIQELLRLNAKERVKCYLKCFMEKEGFWANGSFQMEKVREIIGQFRPLQQFAGAISGVLDKCKNAEGKDDCDKAFEIVKCAVTNAMQLLRGMG